MMIGALYDQNHLLGIAEGLRLWGGQATLVYVGSEIQRFRTAMAGWTIETPGYVDLPQMRQLAATCHATLYVRNPGALYQHKVLELLALDRPILCLPEETDEVLAIARNLGAHFESCASPEHLAKSLAQVIDNYQPVDRVALAQYTWDAQARNLLELLA